MSQLALGVNEDHLGTPEAAWLGSPRLAALAPLVPADFDRLVKVSSAPRVVVLAPHPDDEVLAVGGLLATLARSGWQVEVVAVTDGEGSHPRSRTVTPDRSSPCTSRSRSERERALARLGIDGAGVTAPRQPGRRGRATSRDQPGSRAHRGIGDPLRHVRARARVCLAPWSNATAIPDHDAVGRAARRRLSAPLAVPPARSTRSGPGTGRARTATSSPGSARAPRSSSPRRAAGGEAAAPSPPIARRSRRSAAAAIGDEAILPPAVLARFHRPFEVLFT